MRLPFSTFFPAASVPGAFLAVAAVSVAADVSAQHPGATIYQDMCAKCHGDRGQGVAGKHDEPIYGEKSLAALAKYIDRSMPEDEEETLDAKGSAQVAEWIYNEFYSTTARARMFPEKRAAARLTNRQFQESAADVIASLQPPQPRGAATGLHGDYFQSDGMNKKARKGLQRVDRSLVFDFGEAGPAEGIAADQFSISWDGSLLPQNTGWHDFRVRTPNGARLYLNTDLQRGAGNHRDDSGEKGTPPTIDAWVSSGTDVREVTARVFLLGGRSYPIRFDYFKYKDKLGSVRLEWKPPGGEWEVLAAPWLSPESSRPVTTVTVNFPADDASSGFERGVSVSKDWHEATTKAALELGAQVLARLRRLSGADDKAPDRAEKCKVMLAAVAERAFRRPLTGDLRVLYVDKPFADGVPVELAVKRSLVAIFKSPRFLYPELGAQDDPFKISARLALTLWDSIPDADLLNAAGRGETLSPDQVRRQAERMLKDPRTRTKIAGFFADWLGMNETDHLDKDKTAFPGFDAQLVCDMRRSLELFIDHVVWSETADYRQLLLADYLFLNPRLAKYYGVAVPETDGFVKVSFDPAQRAGVLTHPLVLTSLSYHKSTSPIHRGVFLTRSIMGRFLKPPPMAIEFMDDRFDPSLTMREKVTQLTGKTACMGCHVMINPLGFSLENFDATGRWRTTDNHKAVDPVSDYLTVDGETVKLRGPRDLALHAAENRTARRGFVRQLFQHLVKQPPSVCGPETLERLEESFSASNCNLQKLIVDITVAAVLGKVPAPATSAATTSPPPATQPP
ncbi:MAG: DUF1592 domain-containing protein [Verrucomicrobiales bacterium]|nr:DUF1592 domain-containing protein [Verrucomicrobiales bacterium]